MRDLSIRGAGDILGSEQAGFVDTIGVDLFLEMLNNEINKIKGIKVEDEVLDSNLPLIDVETSIDNNYVNEEELRIEIHKQINEIDSLESIEQTKMQLEDRFGKLDENIIIYMYEEWFEKIAAKINIKDIKQTKNFIEITVREAMLQNIDVQNVFYEVSSISRMFRFSMRGKNLIITLDIVKLEKHFIYYLIELYSILEKNIKNK